MIEKPKDSIKPLTEIGQFTAADAIAWLKYIASDEEAMLDMIVLNAKDVRNNLLKLAQLGIQGGWNKSTTLKPNESELFSGLFNFTLPGARTVEIAYWIVADPQIRTLFKSTLASFTLAEHRIASEENKKAAEAVTTKVRAALYGTFLGQLSNKKPPAS